MESQRERDRIPEEVYECSKADNEYRNLRRQSARSLRTLVAISAHLLRSYDFHTSNTESSQFVSRVAKYVNEPSGRISHHAAGSRGRQSRAVANGPKGCRYRKRSSRNGLSRYLDAVRRLVT